MFDEGGPSCWLLKQGSFFVGADFLPEEILANVDDELGVAAFPPAEAGGENPVLGGGDLAVLLSDDEASKKAINMLATADIGNEAAPVSSFISPFKTFDSSLYPSETTKEIAQVAYDSTAFLFDGSDSMPAAVGAGIVLEGDDQLDQRGRRTSTRPSTTSSRAGRQLTRLARVVNPGPGGAELARCPRADSHSDTSTTGRSTRWPPRH